jgi:TPR repeat protein
MTKILSIKSQLRGGNYALSAEDSAFLIEQSLTQNPEATLIAGLIIFNEAQSTLTEQIAFGYIKSSAESGFAPAMIFLANLYLEGAGCTADHSSAFYWLERHIEKGAPYYELKIFPYMLQWFEFRRGLEISFNGKKYEAGEGEIKSLNIWSLKCKKRIYENQLQTINKKPRCVRGWKNKNGPPAKGFYRRHIYKTCWP